VRPIQRGDALNAEGDFSMLRFPFAAIFLGLGVFAGGIDRAAAHPHVWVTIASEVVYAPDGSATAVRHHWTFDDMFSTFATQGMDAKKPGGLTRQELAPLAEVNISSLKEFDYFTQARAAGKKAAFVDPKDYWLEHKNGLLTLHFTLPFRAAVQTKELSLEIYDPQLFVDFSLAKDGAAALVGAPPACKISASSARDTPTAQAPMNESFFQSLDPSSNFGAQFANRISVTCP
jgi:ABC-type uncharacterized transport system substrate-binding protein